jgi:rhodanese-related sulfurtransferase
MDDSISPEALCQASGRFPPPLLLDLRRQASDRILPGAVHRTTEAIEEWARDLEIGRPIVVYDDAGGETGRNIAALLRGRGFIAADLTGGFAGWVGQDLPTQPAQSLQPTLWVTRERPKIDRIACPWLIRRFVDPDARFLYVPADQVLAVAASTGAVPYDIPNVEFSHRGERCSFDAFIERYRLDDPALGEVALIVRGADTSRLDLAPASPGLFAISLGLSALFEDDHRMLRHGLVVYDALYAWCRSLRGETHNWPPVTTAPAGAAR